MKDITIPQGDFGYAIDFTLTDAAKNVYNPTGYTVKFKVWEAGTPGVLIVEGDCVIVDAAAGIVRYYILDGDLATAGEYEGEIELSKAGIAVESFKGFKVIVTESG
ncbi:MAG: BppU family phage baseplate upper protein [Candidatus Omnitrophota bacterium]|jgi:hypothetical protein